MTIVIVFVISSLYMTFLESNNLKNASIILMKVALVFLLGVTHIRYGFFIKCSPLGKRWWLKIKMALRAKFQTSRGVCILLGAGASTFLSINCKLYCCCLIVATF